MEKGSGHHSSFIMMENNDDDFKTWKKWEKDQGKISSQVFIRRNSEGLLSLNSGIWNACQIVRYLKGECHTHQCNKGKTLKNSPRRASLIIFYNAHIPRFPETFVDLLGFLLGKFMHIHEKSLFRKQRRREGSTKSFFFSLQNPYHILISREFLIRKKEGGSETRKN